MFVHLQVKSHTSTTVFLGLVMHSKYAKEFYSVSSWPYTDSICLLMAFVHLHQYMCILHMHKLCVDIRNRCTVHMYTPTHVHSMYVNTEETCICVLNYVF